MTEVIGFGERAWGKGLFFVDTPGNDLISLTGLAAAGCNVITYSTGYLDWVLGECQGYAALRLEERMQYMAGP